MIVQVTPDVRVKYDGSCWALEKRVTVRAGPKTKEGNEGKERWDCLGYYGWLSQALQALLGRRSDVWLGRDVVVSLKEMVSTLDEAELRILGACQGVSRLVRNNTRIERLAPLEEETPVNEPEN